MSLEDPRTWIVSIPPQAAQQLGDELSALRRDGESMRRKLAALEGAIVRLHDRLDGFGGRLIKVGSDVERAASREDIQQLMERIAELSETILAERASQAEIRVEDVRDEAGFRERLARVEASLEATDRQGLASGALSGGLTSTLVAVVAAIVARMVGAQP
jgi:tetrahydromethanopterin S-methyltransferase subunit F